jgi:hypothetical protein
MPEPEAYYWFNEGSGTKLKESMSGDTEAGYVDYEVADQPAGSYPGETWVVDPNFGNVFQCGNKDTMAKDVLRLADVDYGRTGKWTINFWVRNPIGSDFPDREREQVFGHGDAQEITNAPNQIHIQLENLHLTSSSPGGEVSTIVGDSNDFQSCIKEGVVTEAQLEGTATNTDRELVEQMTGMDVFPATTCPSLMVALEAEIGQENLLNDVIGAKCMYNATTEEVLACNRVGRGRSIKSTHFAEDGTTELGAIGFTNDEWHMMTLTSQPDGTKGFRQYLDGVNRAGIPYVAGVGSDPGYENGPVNGGDPIDPVGPMRFCGREKPGDWSGEAGARFDEERYCNLELAHFSVYADAMTAAQVEELRQAYLTAFFPKHVDGYSSQAGACRGPGGENDKVNGKYKYGVTLDACAQECNNNAGCKGFVHNPISNGGECVVYGPGLSGACSDSSAKSPTACAALGTCSDADKTSEETCGACSDSSGTSKSTCEQIDGTWTPATWTSADATWTDPSGGWMSDYYTSDLVVSVVESGGYTCYDVDPYDHHPTCEGVLPVDTTYLCTEADVTNDVTGCGSTSDYNCATATCGTSNCGGDCDGCASGCAYCTETCGKFSGNCEYEFVDVTMDLKTEDRCPEGCSFTGEVKAMKVTVLHSTAVKRKGWRIMAGVCRSEGDAMSLEAKPNGRYSKTAGANGAAATQEECMDHCAASDDCIGYAHADNSWCLLYGPDLHVVSTEDEATWYSDNHPQTTITQTKPNPAYICGVKDPSVGTTTTAKPTDKADDAMEGSMCRRGAMVALSLWLASFLQ